MLTRSEIKALLKEQPAFDDISNCMRGAARFPNRALLKEVREIVALARKVLSHFFTTSRLGVAAFGTGVARGPLKRRLPLPPPPRSTANR